MTTRIYRRQKRARNQLNRNTVSGTAFLTVTRTANRRTIDLSVASAGALHHPAVTLGRMMEEAMDPVRAPGKVKRFSREEIAKMNAERSGK